MAEKQARPRVTVSSIARFTGADPIAVKRVVQKLGFGSRPRTGFNRWETRMILEMVYRRRGAVACRELLQGTDQKVPKLGIIRRP